MIPEVELEVNPYTGEVELEMWRDIPGYEGYYQVSNYGRVKSVERDIKNKHGQTMHFQERLKKQFVNDDGYNNLQLNRDCKWHWFSVHRLVANAFIPNPENKEAVNHKRGEKTNNRAWELEWSTKSENEAHAHATGLKNFKRQKRKLTWLEVCIIREAIASGFNQSKIARYFNIHRGSVSAIKHNKSWVK